MQIEITVLMRSWETFLQRSYGNIFYDYGSLYTKWLPVTLVIMKVLGIGKIHHTKQMNQNMTKKI